MTDAPAPTTSRIPERPTLDGLEEKWMQVWEDEQTYAFDRDRALSLPRDQVFAIDTPPPTASGSLHVGHVFSYTHTDCMARYKRMQGLEVFYPIGWDDNGLPTERRVQNYYGVRGDAALPTSGDYEPPFSEGVDAKEGDQACRPAADHAELHRASATSSPSRTRWPSSPCGDASSWLDWNISYRTIDDAQVPWRSRRSCATSPVARPTRARRRASGT